MRLGLNNVQRGNNYAVTSRNGSQGMYNSVDLRGSPMSGPLSTMGDLNPVKGSTMQMSQRLDNRKEMLKKLSIPGMGGSATPRVETTNGSSVLPNIDSIQKKSSIFSQRGIRTERGNRQPLRDASNESPSPLHKQSSQDTSPQFMKGSFDLSAYKIANDLKQYKGPNDVTSFTTKSKKISFIDENNKLKSVVPSPEKYIKNVVWCESHDNTSAKKGKFFKDQRVTTTETIFKQQLKFPTPSSTKYENFKTWGQTSSVGKIPGTMVQKEERGPNHFTEQPKFLASLMPPIGHYKSIDLESIKNRSSKWKHQKDKTVGYRTKKIEKNSDPSPFTYNAADVFFKTQVSGSAKMQTITKSKIKSFIDVNVEERKFAPGVGQYKDVEKAFENTGRSLFLRSKRY